MLDFRTITAIRGLEFAWQARYGQNDPQLGQGQGGDPALPVSATTQLSMEGNQPVDEAPD
jgi:hypothetical protein